MCLADEVISQLTDKRHVNWIRDKIEFLFSIYLFRPLLYCLNHYK